MTKTQLMRYEAVARSVGRLKMALDKCNVEADIRFKETQGGSQVCISMLSVLPPDEFQKVMNEVL